MTVDEHTARVEGRSVSYLRRRGASPTLVLVHGAGANEQSWAPLLDMLEGIDVVAPSLPGRGGSRGPPCRTAAEAGRWVRALLEALHLDDAVVGGHSYGGGVALEAAFADRDAEGDPRIGGLVLMATGARLRVHPTILELMEHAAAQGTPADARGLVWQPDTDPALVARVEAARASTPPATELADWRAADGLDRLGQLSSLTVPALVVGGTDDSLTPPKFARYLAAHLPDARLAVLESAGHMLPFERAGEAAAAIRDFLAEIEQSG